MASIFWEESVPKVDLLSHISSFVIFAKDEKIHISCHLEKFQKKMTRRTFHHQQIIENVFCSISVMSCDSLITKCLIASQSSEQFVPRKR